MSLFATAEEYLAEPSRAEVDCLVIDVRFPGIGRLELLEQLQTASPRLCLVIAAHERVAESRFAGTAGN